ncbi:oleate hydratase, partial [Bradyrhizobium sp.]
FTDSYWRMSIVLYTQPYFPDQPADIQIFWGYGLFPDRVGNFVPKPMSECSGAEILKELCGHLRLPLSVFENASCVPCWMPYIMSMFMPRSDGDRPLPVPLTSKNLAFIGQYVELPEDAVFTIEYSVRAAMHAVYQLLNIDRAIPPVTPYDKSLKVLLQSVAKSFA